jgi:uncharacterized protein with FMN-binding domain
MQTMYDSQSKTKLLSIVIAVIVVADHIKAETSSGKSGLKTSSMQSSAVTVTPVPAPSNSAATTTATPTATTTPTLATTYKNGTYSFTSDYAVPHGDEQIRVSLTIQNDTITDSSITNSENDGTSASYQQDFASVYKNYVVGKKVSGLKLNRISGASDTTIGFNDALARIASQAKA